MSLLEQQLYTVAGQFRRLDWWRSASAFCLLMAVVGGVLLMLQVNGVWSHPRSGWIIILSGLVGLIFVTLTTMGRYRDKRWIADSVENHYPELEQRLSTTLDELDRNDGKPLGYLQHRVFQETISHAHYNPWWKVVPADDLFGYRLSGLISFGLLLASAFGLMRWYPTASTLAAMNMKSAISGPVANFDIQVEPGDTEVEKGTNLIVVARFGKQIPKSAEVVATSGGEELRIPMSRSLDDPLFGGTVSDVTKEFEYHVAYAGRKSESFRATVFTYPELVRGDALLEYPSYTSLPEKRIEDTRRVSAVEGTRLTWEMHVNKPGISAELVPIEPGEVIPLLRDATDPLKHLASIELTETITWRLILKDEDGRENRTPPKLTVKVNQNQPPTLKLEYARDANVSPLEEFLVKATVADDYGLQQFGLSYTLASASEQHVVLGESVQRREKKSAEHLLDFEAMEAAPDELLSYYFWAEDRDANGEVRRTLSDMYFAEVRHFEEIFRQGEQQPGGEQQQQQQQQQGEQSQAAQDAEQLAELQKQIINATWRLIRRETTSTVTPVFAEDVTTIVESQQSAADQAAEMGQDVQDDESQEYLLEVRKYMQTSQEQLLKAFSDSSVAPMTPALAAQRLAYQSLLKLRAREHEVVQQQQQQRGQQSSQSQSRQRFQQQLQQLELQNDQNRYETQRQAQEEQSQEQTELRQALNRLRELAQRQEDLNEQLKELQNALEQAESEEEREEINRQLKRLRDQQQEMLRDTDELMDRLEESPNQETLQETRDQLEETREQLRDSAESLEKGEVTPALASGTRAQRELEEMKEELRRESSNQFTDQLREMRQEARDLETKQQEIGQALAEQGQQANRTGGLRDQNETDQALGDKMREQNQKLNDLLDEIEQTVEEAAETEPLLAESLFDAFRDVEDNRVKRNLDAAAQLADRGLNDQAEVLENEAREGISNLRENIEQAAERVLGDETDALRTAVDMLQDLEQQLRNEINQFDESQQPGDSLTQQSLQQNPESRQQSPSDQQGQQENGPPSGEQANGGQAQSDASETEGEQQPQSEDRPSENQQDAEQDRQQQERNQQEQRDQQQQQQEESQRRGQPGQQPGQSEQESQQQGSPPSSGGNGRPQEQESQDQQPSEQQESQQPGSQPGGQNPQGGQPSQPQQGQPQQSGQRQLGQQSQNGQRRSQQDGGGGRTDQGGVRLGGLEQLDVAPITGDDFRQWSDRLRDIEEIVEDPELRAEAARIREEATSFRREFKRHSEEPKWNLVRELVSRPLRELRQGISEELLRRSAEKNQVVPIDRDPVPDEFVEQVRRYYENLGSGQ